MDLQQTRDAIVLATLPHVAFDGWVNRALAAGVVDAGLSPDVAVRAFPDGISEVIRHWSGLGDRQMLERLGDLDLDSMRVRDRVVAAVRARIEVNAPYREAVRRTLAYIALPMNTWIGARNVFATVNAMWYAAGDTSTDFNFYTKRALLAPVYTSTVLYWLAGESDDFADTWAFLERRVADVLQIPKLQAQVAGRLSRKPRMPRFRRARRRHRTA